MIRRRHYTHGLGMSRGMPSLAQRGGGGSPVVDNRAATLAQSPIWMFDTADATTRLRTSGASAGVGDSVETVTDLSGNGYNLLQTVGADQPLVSADGVSLDFDGANHFMIYENSRTINDASCSLFYALKTTDDWSLMLGSTVVGQEYLGAWRSGGSASPDDESGTGVEYYVNGVQVTPETQDGLHDAVAVGAWVLVEARLADFTLWSTFHDKQFGRYTTGAAAAIHYLGQMANPVLIPTANITNRTAIEAFVMESVI